MIQKSDGALIFSWAAFYGLALGALVLSGNFTSEIIYLFCRKEAYTLGTFGEVWANWHAIGCIFVGLTNLVVALDNNETDFKPKARSGIAMNTSFIFGVWGAQNLYYCLYRQDLFVSFMWLHTILCLMTSVLALTTGVKKPIKLK